MNVALQDIVFPRSCPVCGKVTPNGADICPDCEDELREIGGQVCQKCGQPVTGEADMWCPACAKSLRGEEFLRYQLPQGENRTGFSGSQRNYGKIQAGTQGDYLTFGGKEHHFTKARALYRYNGPMRQSIYRLKYKNAKEYAIYYGKKMAEYVAEGTFGNAPINAHTHYAQGDFAGNMTGKNGRSGMPGGNGAMRVDRRYHGYRGNRGNENPQPGYDAIIPVPMYRKKQKKRGYNQAELLATEMGYHLGIPVLKHYLLRVRETAPMKELSRSERRRNLKEAFAVRNTGRSAPKSVLLVDDIFTTGATADACAHALRLVGVHRIDCLCLAREDLSL